MKLKGKTILLLQATGLVSIDLEGARVTLSGPTTRTLG